MSDKKVDESWKKTVAKEKSTQPEEIKKNNNETPEKTDQEERPSEMPPVDFNLFISSLGMQALMALGEIENPMTNKKEKQLPQAKYLIDTIELLETKTKGNLDDQESKVMEALLYELRMKFISVSKE